MTAVPLASSRGPGLPPGPHVPTVRTDPAPGASRFGRDRVRAFIRSVLLAYQQAGATPAMAALLTAHSALAVGWGRNVFNWNIGVIRATHAWQGPWAGVDTRECVDAACTSYNRGLPGSDPWRAYVDLTASAADVMHLLSSSSRYAHAWELLQRGDPSWFIALGHAGWYGEPTDRHFPRYRAVLARVTATVNERG